METRHNLTLRELPFVQTLDSPDMQAFRSRVYAFLEDRGIAAAPPDREASILSCIRGCRMCSLWKDNMEKSLPSYRPENKVLFIGRNPGRVKGGYGMYQDANHPSGHLFREYLRILNLNPSEVNTSDMVLCNPWNDRAPDTAHFQRCGQWKSFEIEWMSSVRYIFMMGNEILRFFYGRDFPSILSVYGSFYKSTITEGRDVIVIPLLHPGFVLRNPEWGDSTRNVLLGASRLIGGEIDLDSFTND